MKWCVLVVGRDTQYYHLCDCMLSSGDTCVRSSQDHGHDCETKSGLDPCLRTTLWVLPGSDPELSYFFKLTPRCLLLLVRFGPIWW
jgi:hypothetical protein